MSGKPYRGGKVHVLDDQCETCIFRPGNPMFLDPGRVKGMVDAAIASESAIICHSTLYSEGVDQAVCRGFFDKYTDRVRTLSMAVWANVIEYDPVPELSNNATRADS